MCILKAIRNGWEIFRCRSHASGEWKRVRFWKDSVRKAPERILFYAVLYNC